LFNVSVVELAERPAVKQALPEGSRIWEEDVIPRVEMADGQKCARCWHWETDVGLNTDHPTICGRCVEAVQSIQG
jgi:isoleucyl-tRNA synthetase